jgi:hypothetical protein
MRVRVYQQQHEKMKRQKGNQGNWTDKYGLKLPKTLKDMLVNLIGRINGDEELRRKIQTIGVIQCLNLRFIFKCLLLINTLIL